MYLSTGKLMNEPISVHIADDATTKVIGRYRIQLGTASSLWLSEDEMDRLIHEATTARYDYKTRLDPWANVEPPADWLPVVSDPDDSIDPDDLAAVNQACDEAAMERNEEVGS